MIKSNLSDISSPVKNELSEFSRQFKNKIRSNVGLVDLIANYILKQKGKKVRPLMVILSAAAVGSVSERTYRGATLVELLHTATLVHDDVVDNADKRRGLPSINAVWKNKIAVLMGDYLLSRGLMIAVDGQDFDFLKVITDTVKRMSEGELLQIQKTRKLDIDEEAYFRIISDKTASLFQTCCVTGAMSATDRVELHNAFATFGEMLGIAFQIKDDILDYDGSFSLFGKTIGADIREKKITLPLIAALSEATSQENKHIKSLLKNINKRNAVKEVIDFVHAKEGIQYAEQVAREYAEFARRSLDIVEDSVYKQALLALVEFVVERKK